MGKKKVQYTEEDNKKAASHRLKEARVDKKTAIEINIEYKETDEKRKDELIEKLKANIPEAKITSEVGPGECFEIHYNNKLVYSRRELRKYPNPDEMVEIAYWMNQGRNFMHMYLCTFVDGGEPNMDIADRKATPIAKRAILACVIS